MIKGYEMVDACKKRLGWGYVLGGQGELYSFETAKRFYEMFKEKPLSYYTETCAKWFGKCVVDCSGLIIEAFRDYETHDDQTANTLYAECIGKGKIADIPEIEGLCVWKKGHIGIYIGGGKVIESRGAAYGVVITNVKDRPWTNWGKLKGVAYEESGQDGSVKAGFELTRVLKWRMRNMTGADIKVVQCVLIKEGFSCGKCGADGIFGDATRKAVRSFQRTKGLAIDGIVGKNTCTALGGTWIA